MQRALVIQASEQPVPLRDIASLVFRRKRLLLISFCAIVCVAFVVALLLPRKYESSVKLLVERERADSVISPERNEGGMPASAEEITEAELDSEQELLRTHDILRGVVLKNGLAGRNPSPAKIDLAIDQLNSRLHIDPINKSNIIGVTYRSSNPQLSANVLSTLVGLYLQKHLEVTRPVGEYEFFDQQARRYAQQLTQVEKQIASSHIVAPELTRDHMVDKLADLKASEDQTSAAIAETERRIASLKDLETRTPERLVTEKRSADNPQLLQTLNATLLTLQLQRDQLLAKYQPDYRPVLDLNKQIADAQAAIAREENSPVRDVSTNQNTAYEWIRTELAKAEADLQGLRGRERADSLILSSDDEDLRSLNVNSIAEQDLLRQEKAAEDNYALYSQKREEARISEELDARKILNVVVVQSAFVPATHVHRRTKLVLIGGVVAIVLSLGFILIADYFDPRFRSLHELATSLDVPILAAIPSSHELSRFNTSPPRPDFPQHRTV